MGGEKKGARVRAAAAEAIDAVANSGRSLDDALATYEPRVDDNDRALLRMLSYGCLRHHWRLNAWIDTLVDRPFKRRDSVVRALLAVGLYQLTDTRIPDHAAVSQTVEAARLLRRPKHAGLLNAVMRRFMREQTASQDPATRAAEFDHPDWLIDAIKNDWPDDWRTILAANNDRAPMWLRCNRQQVAVPEYLQQLQASELDGSALGGLDDAVRLDAPVVVASLPGFSSGKVSVQDAAAQLAAPWLLRDVNGRILDACAAPGGKSAHLKEIAGDAIELTCLDIDDARCERIRQTLDRLALDATVLTGDASLPGEWWDQKAYDGILLDAPCSASGVIRRHPDIKLLRRASDISALGRRQAQILRACWSILAPGGRLLYATCSVLAAENDDVIGDFLTTTADARENDMLPNNNIRDVMRRTASGYQVLPGTAGMDGFYYSCLEKVA
ncbi:MAG: 16S rRNA (cytosine(967)-C(5))-methyltransferase RsmB [Woeseiaceae bacterium]|nr:16S rRNA (cytosine(967)-C(5))-methyltransferase RsmB [Woeseiaceae bacterium]